MPTVTTPFILIVAIAVIVIYLIYFRSSKAPSAQEKVVKQYSYIAKTSIMTTAETIFFQRLEHISGDRYHVFPQIHLSSLLDNRVKGQNWRAALAHIQRKSVDFVLVDKQTMHITYVVELDDATHDRYDRKRRDDVVGEILQSVGIPLVRFRNAGNISDDDIANEFRRVHQTHYAA